MRLRRGIFIAKDGKSVGPGDNRYESDKPRLLTSLIQTPPHLDLQTFAGGTSWTVGAGGDQSETLLTIPHNLPYTPEVLVYFYVISYGGSTSHIKAAVYMADRLWYTSGAGADDLIYASVDGTNLEITHQTQTGPGYTSDAAQYQIRLKCYILSNDSHVTSYNTRGY